MGDEFATANLQTPAKRFKSTKTLIGVEKTLVHRGGRFPCCTSKHHMQISVISAEEFVIRDPNPTLAGSLSVLLF